MRNIPAELTKRYEEEGWWTLDTLGDLVARSLAANPGTGFWVHSAVRPFAGTFADSNCRPAGWRPACVNAVLGQAT